MAADCRDVLGALLGDIHWVSFLIYGAVAVIGALVGSAELTTRYRDAPVKAMRLPAGMLYILINATAGLLALYLMRAFQWTFGGETEAQQTVMQVIAAGFAAMAFLRSSLFNVRVGDADVAVGPSALLTALLAAADRDIDKRRGTDRVATAAALMHGFDVDRHADALFSIISMAMQNLTGDEIDGVTKAIQGISELPADRDEKATTLGLVLLNVAGKELLEASLRSLAAHPGPAGAAVNPAPPPATPAGSAEQGDPG